jgi:hypothetical protein
MDMNRIVNRIIIRGIIDKVSTMKATEPSSDDPERMITEDYDKTKKMLTEAWDEVEEEKYGCATVTDTDATMETLLASLLPVTAKKK